jgi:uncharacterized phage protein (TIGR01671 family)
MNKREIKFRIFDGENMVYGWTDIETSMPLMQYVGLKDKNEVEIYEGDVIKGVFLLDEVAGHIYLSLTAEEKKTQSKLFVIEDIFSPYITPLPEDIEVIGNIYEDDLINFSK